VYYYAQVKWYDAKGDAAARLRPNIKIPISPAKSHNVKVS
jgi:hypothetical protein